VPSKIVDGIRLVLGIWAHRPVRRVHGAQNVLILADTDISRAMNA
jgi:hypothetical protein